jgi:oligopeptide transport system substrate-binding protein
MPVVALWDYINAAGRSAAVHDVAITWNGLPAYEAIVKSA